MLAAILALVGAIAAAAIGVLAKQTSDLGKKLDTGIPTGFWDDFHRGAEAWVKLSDAKTPVSQIIPAPRAQITTAPPAAADTKALSNQASTTSTEPPAIIEGRCFGLDPENWQITKGPVTALGKGFNIKLSLLNKSAVPRGLAFFGDPAMTDNIGDRLTYLTTSLPSNDRQPLTIGPGVDMPLDLTFPNGAFADPSGKQVAAHLSFTLPIHEVVENKVAVESLACENLAIPSRSAK